MPRLSPAVRDARREQIADAALECIARDGIAGTSMADIVRASGLSSGSIYSHFTGKEEILRFAAERMLSSQAAVADTAEGPVTPDELARRVVAAFREAAPRSGVLQVWAEVARDPELTRVGTEVLGQVHALQRTVLLPWARAHRDDEESAVRLAGRAADAVIGVVHAHAVRTSVDPGRDADELLTTLVAGLAALADHLPRD